MNANHFQLLDGKSRLFCGPAKNLRGPAIENHWSNVSANKLNILLAHILSPKLRFLFKTK